MISSVETINPRICYINMMINEFIASFVISISKGSVSGSGTGPGDPVSRDPAMPEKKLRKRLSCLFPVLVLSNINHLMHSFPNEK